MMNPDVARLTSRPILFVLADGSEHAGEYHVNGYYYCHVHRSCPRAVLEKDDRGHQPWKRLSDGKPQPHIASWRYFEEPK